MRRHEALQRLTLKAAGCIFAGDCDIQTRRRITSYRPGRMKEESSTLDQPIYNTSSVKAVGFPRIVERQTYDKTSEVVVQQEGHQSLLSLTASRFTENQKMDPNLIIFLMIALELSSFGDYALISHALWCGTHRDSRRICILEASTSFRNQESSIRICIVRWEKVSFPPY